MSVRVTDFTHVALYDSVSGTTFGPLFDSTVDAWEFLDWLPVGADNQDARDMEEKRLLAFHREWKEETARE